MSADPLWQASVTVARGGTAPATAAFEEAGAVAVSSFADGDGWTVAALFQTQPAGAALTAALAQRLGAAVRPELSQVAPRDWVAATAAAFPPLAIGPFWVHGSHCGPPDGARIPIQIDAGPAFGTGEHATTRGCLLALAALRQRGFHPGAALDVGCGSGILAIAAAKLYHCAVIAIDNDPAAIAFARRAAAANGAAQRIAVLEGEGCGPPQVAARAPFDLALANLFATALLAMAAELAALLKQGGVAILSGMLAGQAQAVAARYRQAGFALDRRLETKGWTTLAMVRV